GLNGNTGLYFEPRSGSTPQSITVNGNGTMSVTGDLSVTGTITCGTPPLVRERYETTATGDGRWAIPWEITAAKNGYTPIMWSAPIRGNSLTVKVGVETVLFGSGQLKVSGFTDLANGVSMPIRVDVLWLRNN
ncbi:MAG: hypothetical protein ACSW8J_07615, partial [bacterium]